MSGCPGCPLTQTIRLQTSRPATHPFALTPAGRTLSSTTWSGHALPRAPGLESRPSERRGPPVLRRCFCRANCHQARAAGARNVMLSETRLWREPSLPSSEPLRRERGVEHVQVNQTARPDTATDSPRVTKLRAPSRENAILQNEAGQSARTPACRLPLSTSWRGAHQYRLASRTRWGEVHNPRRRERQHGDRACGLAGALEERLASRPRTLGPLFPEFPAREESCHATS
jgi:hypothetical protein